MPRSPVAALALPLFATTAWTPPVSTASRVTTRGAPQTALRVNTAAVSQGSSEKRSPRSRLPASRTPHATPAATKPEAAVTPGERDFIPIVESLFITGAAYSSRGHIVAPACEDVNRFMQKLE